MSFLHWLSTPSNRVIKKVKLTRHRKVMRMLRKLYIKVPSDGEIYVTQCRLCLGCERLGVLRAASCAQCGEVWTDCLAASPKILCHY